MKGCTVGIPGQHSELEARLPLDETACSGGVSLASEKASKTCLERRVEATTP